MWYLLPFFPRTSRFCVNFQLPCTLVRVSTIPKSSPTMNGNFINNLPPQFASHNGQILPQGSDSSRIPSSLQYPGDNLGYMEADFTSSERWQSHGVNPKDIFGSLPMATSHSSMSMGRGMPPSLGVNTGIDRMDHKGNPYVVGFDLTGSRGHLVHVPPPMMQPQEHFYPPVQGGRADAIPTGTGYPGFPLGTSGSSRSTNVPDESGRYSSTRKCVRTSAKKSVWLVPRICVS